MFLKSNADNCSIQMIPCEDDHGASLHVTVALQARFGALREHHGRHVCPAGITEGAVWFSALLNGLVSPGSKPVLLCDAATIGLVSLTANTSVSDPTARYGLIIEVPNWEEETVEDSLGLFVTHDELLATAAWWQEQAETVVRIIDLD